VRKLLALTMLLPLTSSCLHTMTATQVRPVAQPQERRQDFLLWGLVPLQSFNATQCPEGISRVDTGMSFANFLFTTITLGVYWGEKVEVWCADDVRTAQSLPSATRGFYVVPTQ
jgi:hypothetical protein